MSFLGQVDAAGLPVVAANMPAWGHGLVWPEGPASAGLPTVNAGPWGRDYHTPMERLHTGYAFKVLPDLRARDRARGAGPRRLEQFAPQLAVS